MRILCELIGIAVLSHLVDFAKSFPPQYVLRRIHGEKTNRSVSRNIRFDAGNQEGPDVDNEGESINWTMEEDWALIDNLPLFTVSTTSETKTFWAQLWSANPILFAKKQPHDLQQRIQELQREINRRETSEKENGGIGRKSLVFGDSPPVLDNWKLDLEQHGNKIGGQLVERSLGGRRTIWFHYHSIGRLEGDPFADQASSVTPLLPGGYIEAIGGRIYELGQPMLLDKWDQVETRKIPTIEKYHIDRKDYDGGDEHSSTSRWWLPSSTAAISALVSSTILSACIGYGAGLSIIQDGSNHHHIPQPTPTMLTVETVLAGPSQSSSSMIVPATKSSDPNALPSIQERQARAQYRVLREERLLKKISQRLEVDKQNLKQLDNEVQQSSRLLP